MALTANTSILLGAHKPKSAAVIATDGGHTTGANDVTIWAGSTVSLSNITELVCTFEKLLTYALSELRSLPPEGCTVHSPVSPSDGMISIGGNAGAAECSIELGSTLVDKQQSHFIKRTTDRLLEVLLERAK